MKHLIVATMILFLGACKEETTAPTDAEEQPIVGAFVVDTSLVSAVLDSSSRVVVSARIAYRFAGWPGIPTQFSFWVVGNGEIIGIPDYASPLESDRVFIWVPSIKLGDSLPGRDSISVRSSIRGRFWKPDSGYLTKETFSWVDSQTVAIVR
jgi:hypothetical protein